MPRVTFLHSQGKSGTIPRNTTLLDAAKEIGFSLNHDCGGNASCTTCRVEVESGGENLYWIGKPSASHGTDSGVRQRCSAM